MQKIIFWNPSAAWKFEEGVLIIEEFVYSEKFVDLFPAFYFITQNGIQENDLYEYYKSVNGRLLKKFIEDLKSKKILISNVVSPGELFYNQSKLVENKYGEELLINESKLLQFKEKNYSRDYSKNESLISLNMDTDYPDIIAKRRSHRDFCQEIIPMEDFKKLCSIYKQSNDNGNITYYYASAGGLYPIDIYYYIKANRIESMEEGTYYYNPRSNSLSLVSKNHIPKTAHYYTNQEIFDSSAFSIFYVFNAEASIPKYGGLGYYYSIIDLGIMVELYTLNAEMNGYGICSIGEMQFEVIKDNFSLDCNQIYLHTVEVGKKNN